MNAFTRPRPAESHLLSPRLTPIARLVTAGLTHRPAALPATLFEDARGRRLFAELVRSPEHHSVRAQRGLVADHAAAIAGEVGARDGAPHVTFVELDAECCGAFNALRAELIARQRWLRYVPVAATEAALAAAIDAVAGTTPSLEVEPRRADFLQTVRFLGSVPAPRLVSALGVRVSELSPTDLAAVLRTIRGMSSERDTLLLAFDLVKDSAAMCAAYDDREGCGKRFGRYALERLNRELGADFTLESWAHEVVWNADRSRVELRLRASQRDRVFVDELGLPLQFEPGDCIHTASFYKYDLDAIDRVLFAGGMIRQASWQDDEAGSVVVLAARQ